MSFSSQEKKSLSIIASLYLVRMLGLFMVLPVLSLYGSELQGATPFLIGLALGIYGLTQALLQIPFGWASDKIGRRKVLLAGFVLFVAGSALCSLSDNINLLIMGRALQGAGAISAVLLALLADMVSEDNRTTSMAVIGVSIGLSFGVSVVAAPVIVSSFGGLSAIFNLSAFLGVMALFLVFVFVRDKSPDKGSAKALDKYSVSLRSLLTPNLMRLDFGIFALHFMQMCIWVAVPGVLFEKLGVPIDNHWAVYLITVSGGFVFMAPFMRFWDKRGQTKTSMFVAISCVLISLLLMSQVIGYRFFVFGLFLFFWGFNLLEATLPSSVTKLASAEAKGTATGIYSTCQFLGVFLGGTAGGLMLSLYGASSVFYLSSVIAFLWLLLMFPAKGLNRKQG